jgi:hypothetical protein
MVIPFATQARRAGRPKRSMPASRKYTYTAFTIASMIFFASPNTIMVFGW